MIKQLPKFLVNFNLLKYVKSRRSYGFLITKELIFGFQFLELKDHFSASLTRSCTYDPFLRIRFLVPKTGSRRSGGPISRFRFCCENVGRSFAVCSHDPFFRTNKESSIWRQNDHAKFVGAFHLSRRVSDLNRPCSISIRFFSKLRILLTDGHF